MRPFVASHVKGYPLNSPSPPWTVYPAVNHYPPARDGTHAPSPALKRRSSLRKLTCKKKTINRAVLIVVPFTSSPSGVCVFSGSHIFCASAVWSGSNDGVTLLSYKSWRRSEAVIQRPPCLCVCCVKALYVARVCVRERRKGAEPCTNNTMDKWWL